MGQVSKFKPLSLRLDPDLHRIITKIAYQRNLSVNALVHEQLELAVRVEEAKARYDAYTQLGQDTELCDVDYARFAQAEVMLRDES